MQFVLDNLVATIVASAMAVVLLASRHSQMENSVERVRHYSAREMEMNFVTLLRSDLHSAVAAESYQQHATDSTFSFQAVYNDPSDPSNTDEQVRITYRVRQYAQVDGQPLYQVHRITTRGNLGVPAIGGLRFAASTTTTTERVLVGITRWQIQGLNNENNSVEEAGAVKRYRVAFSVVAPYTGVSNAVDLKATRALSWNAVYSPPRYRLGFLG